MPVRETLSGLLVALLTMVSVAERDPLSPGLKMTLMTVRPPPVKVRGKGAALVVKSEALVPDTVTLEITILLPP